ncbi:hypothetical protein KIH74_20075 [Kineosporia sp. J2-2]|uniref:Resolvase/invertase-type recombinase catalytic domain-containing protein n=1 Tax=Kineosporia corallincola TaxID=2835133 RepID=A0ABS5TK83_9ACTN|nr:hypothetical protein [Kineosporia corallincola]MBT0771248.1 hypothetical protein [Kineosporia corallincola]
MTVKPMAVGYQRARGGPEAPEVVNGRRVMSAFARREGYSLTEVFEENDPTKPTAALNALVDVIKRLELRVVIVPNVWHLGRTAWTQQATRRLIERAGARVDVAESPRDGGEPRRGGLAPTGDDQTPVRAPATPPHRDHPRPRLVRMVPQVRRTVWTGRLEVPLSDRRDVRTGALSLVARLDHVLIWHGSRLLCVLDRDRLRRWLRDPASAYPQDDVTLSRTRRGRLQLLFDGAPQLVSRETVHHLAAVV